LYPDSIVIRIRSEQIQVFRQGLYKELFADNYGYTLVKGDKVGLWNNREIYCSETDCETCIEKRK